jgi:anthranilate phosphoribosyltransferase
VVHAEDGVDEISVTGPTRVIEVSGGGTEEWFIEPGDYDLAPAALETIAGGSPEDNAAVVRRVLDGQDGPAREVVLLNAGAAIAVGGGADDLAMGISRAREAIDSGGARKVLDRLVELTAEMGS